MKLKFFKKKKYIIEVAGVTDRGKIRKNNQDNMIINQRILMKDKDGFSFAKGKSSLEKYDCFAGVFDGMGGLVNGERASSIAAEEARKMLKISCEMEMSKEELLKKICINANKTVCKEIDATKDKMGTTASMLYFFKDNAWICNIGDSPIYRLRKGDLEPIYEEHNGRKFHIEMLGEESVKGKKFPLTQYLGIPEVEMEICPYVREEELQHGDLYLICSDGLTDMVSEEEIYKILLESKNVTEKVKILRQRALENGGKDNISIFCACIR